MFVIPFGLTMIKKHRGTFGGYKVSSWCMICLMIRLGGFVQCFFSLLEGGGGGLLKPLALYLEIFGYFKRPS